MDEKSLSNRIWFMGIDVGKSGAVAIINGDLSEAYVNETPEDQDQIFSLLMSMRDSTIYKGNRIIVSCMIEKAQAMPKQGVVSMFNYGTNYGMYRMAVIALDLTYRLVPPKLWQEKMLADYRHGGEGTKEAAVTCANFVFQHLGMKFKKTEHHKADALLLAMFGRQLHYNKEYCFL